MPVKPFDVQGHRGARGLRPADTLSAFDHALGLGVSTLEMDAEITKDRIVVLAHDAWLNPDIHLYGDGSPIRTNSEGKGALIRDLTLKELKNYDVGSKFVERFPRRVRMPGERIPSLEDIFIFVGEVGDEFVEFNIEIKFNPEEDNTVPLKEFADLLVALIRKHTLEKRVSIQCFDLAGLKYLKSIAPEIRRVFLVSRINSNTLDDRAGQASPWTAGLSWQECGENMVRFLSKADCVDVLSIQYPLLFPENPAHTGHTVQAIQAMGITLVPWTVNEKTDMERLIDMGVDGIITDYPDVLLALLRERSIPIKNRT